eukprot:6211798-Pleurochrysis_carterae.AAC.1
MNEMSGSASAAPSRHSVRSVREIARCGGDRGIVAGSPPPARCRTTALRTADRACDTRRIREDDSKKPAKEERKGVLKRGGWEKFERTALAESPFATSAGDAGRA